MKFLSIKNVILYTLALVLLFWAISQVQINDFLYLLHHLTFIELSIILFLNLTIWLLQSYRWKILMPKNNISLWRILLHRSSGFTLSYFTPGPQFGGEPLQTYLLYKTEKIPLPQAISSVAMDKAINIFINLVVLAVFCVICWSTFSFLAYVFVAVILSIVLIMTLFLSYKKGKYFFQSLAQHLLGEKVTHIIFHSEQNIKEVIFTGVWWNAIFISLFIWILMIIEYWLSFYFLEQMLEPIQTIALLLMLHFALFLPIPGSWGALESAQIFTILSMGINSSVALGVLVLIRFRDILICGVGFVWLHFALPIKNVPKKACKGNL